MIDRFAVGTGGTRLAAALRQLQRIPGLVVEAGVSLAPLTSLRVGGPVDLWARAESEEALRAFLKIIEGAEIPVSVLGQGSNVLIPDEGMRCAVCQLKGEFAEFVIDGSRVEAGSGVMLARLAMETVKSGLVGLEALAGFPSTVGGAVVMNAGCYGVEIKDLLIEVRGLGMDGESWHLGVDDLDAGYRHTSLQGGRGIVTRALFELETGDPVAARERMKELNRRRWGSLPSGRPNAGSIFKNPPGDHAGRLIDACGLKGRRCGNAMISDRHANVIVNEGGAAAADVLALMVEASRRVKERFDVQLEPELVLMGDLSERWREG